MKTRLHHFSVAIAIMGLTGVAMEVVFLTPVALSYQVYGAIGEKWNSLGGAAGFLGEPLTDELATPDGRGRFNHFQGGSIYWTPATGAHEVHGIIRDKWAALGWERSALRYPTSDEFQDGIYRRSNFQHGFIRWSSQRGVEVSVSLQGDVHLNPVSE